MDAVLRLRLLDEDSPEARRFLGMGFVLYSVRHEPHPCAGLIRIRAEFGCVCGRREEFMNVMDQGVFESLKCDLPSIYQMIVNAGSTDRKHLLEDGYSEAQIDAMEAGASQPVYPRHFSMGRYPHGG